MELLVYPAIYLLWRRRALAERDPGHEKSWLQSVSTSGTGRTFGATEVSSWKPIRD